MTSYCKECGQRIDRQYEWNGLASVPKYWEIDGLNQITHCPGCGEWLTEKALTNHPTGEVEP